MTEQTESSQPMPVPSAEIPYDQQVKHSFMQMIQALKLEDRQKFFLEHRWLDQILWMEKRSNTCRDNHTRLKLTAIIFSVVTPILVGANTFLPAQQRGWESWLKIGTLGISSIVAIAGSIDEFFNYGKRWYTYRQSVEALKSEGWQFFELTGNYNTSKTHADAFSAFAFQVEETIRRDVNLFATQQQNQKDKSTNPDVSEVQNASENSYPLIP